ncbi:MAG: hypothetical protein OEQ12_04850 [Nitrosopumilus sp.]|nr:hypothetical protein [Nitrosopumilus sp.]
MQKISLLVIPLLFSGVPLVTAENFYYIPDHKLEKPPVFCAMEFEDNRLPIAPSQLMEITKNVVLEWKTKLIEATNNPDGWNFQFRTISLQEQQELFFDADCTVNIYFERQPPVGEWDYAGYAESYLTFSEIRIFYLEPIYKNSGKTIEIDGELWEKFEVKGFKNTLTYGLDDTIRHEIGHILGLDHPRFESYQLAREPLSVWSSPSIMLDETEHKITGDVDYKITDYDLRAIINLYGEDGIKEINFLIYVDYVIVGLVLILIIYFIKRYSHFEEFEYKPGKNQAQK